MGIRTKMLNVIFSRRFKLMIVKNNWFYKYDVIETKSNTRTLNNTYYFVYRKKLQSEMFQAKFPGVKVLCLKNVFNV